MKIDGPTGAVEKYLALQRDRPDLFPNSQAGGIVILTSPEAMAAAQESARRLRLQHGMDASDLRIGVLASDPHMLVMRDAVRFADGTLGLYNRVIETDSVAVLPLLDGRPVLIRIFRHGLRSWSWEFPRGACDPGETAEAAAHRELHEEIGATIHKLIALGSFSPGGSSLATRAQFYAAVIDLVGQPSCADGIAEIKVIDVVELEQWIRSSQIIDGFTLSIFARARLARVI